MDTQLSIVGSLFNLYDEISQLVVPSRKSIEINQFVLVLIFGCLFPQNRLASSYFAILLCCCLRVFTVHSFRLPFMANGSRFLGNNICK